MNHSSECGPAGGGGADPSPVVMECDQRGRVLWLSDGARSAFGQPENLVDAVWEVAPSGLAGLFLRASSVNFSPVVRQGGSMWISAREARISEVAPRDEAWALLGLQCDFLNHYFRLQNVERALATRTRRLRRENRGHAILQVEQERQRLGRELHTSVGQMLAAMRLQLEVIASRHTEPPAPVREALERISTLADQALDYVRSLSRRLYPPEWQRLGLESALQQLWDLSGVPQRFEASLRIEPLPREPAFETRILMYRAVQEALSNLARHSHATSVAMALRRDSERLVLTFEDNGVGFDAERLFAAPASLSSGIGLHSIREQAASLGGKLIVQSGPNGTKLEISAPLAGGDGMRPAEGES